MRFLIVDDDTQKVDLVRNFLIDKGATAQDILTAEHAAAARVILSRETVDVLLIDVLLPARAGALPQGANSVELLRQIVEDGTTPAPRHILGITADWDASAAFADDFRSLVTQVLHVTQGEVAWQESLTSLLLMHRRIGDARESNDYDICVINALRFELDAVYATWPLQMGEELLLNRNILYRTGSVALSPAMEKRVVCAHLSQMGPVASTHAVTALLYEFRPRVILMTGICGGFSDQVRIGDIVVADKSWDWQAGKWGDEGDLATALDQRDGAAELVAEARSVEAKLPELVAAYNGAHLDMTSKLVVGPMVTGSSVIASVDIQKVFRKQHRKIAAVDMECYGLYYSAANHAGAPVRSLCIKAVSDLADRAKADDFQSYCAHISAATALEIVRRYFRAPK
ncbi:phosphorylase family protein [Cupriavidus campinensis]|uniref:phosphorylase family protein n=1 Tax=Cupriavidus campinensis TaxID=151783 RepID=UPI0011ECE3AF|nr:response regulator [Cupriavidus campinensis]